MSDKILLVILHTVSRKASTLGLIDMGYTYSQIALFISEATRLGYLVQNNEDLELTDDGISKLFELMEKLKIKKENQWILPQYSYRTQPIGKYDIVMPDKIL